MKSIKPGRGPSFMGGVMSILIGLFGVDGLLRRLLTAAVYCTLRHHFHRGSNYAGSVSF